MSLVFCDDCGKNIAPSRPRVIYAVEVVDRQGNKETSHVYVCGDCEYARQVRKTL
jgi:hypothetical protein